MSSIGESGGKKEWGALVKVYDYMYSTYPDFQKQINSIGFSVIESNEKGDLILETDTDESDIVVDKDKIIKILKKAGLKRFSKIESLTLDRVLEYDYNMSKGMLNILINRNKGSLSLNLHYYYVSGVDIPEIRCFLMKRGSEDWSTEFELSDFHNLFSSLLIKPLYKEGLYWIHMVKDTLQISVVSDGEIVESLKYGEDSNFDDVVGKFLSMLGDMFKRPIKEIFLLGEDISKVRYRNNSDGEISVVVY